MNTKFSLHNIEITHGSYFELSPVFTQFPLLPVYFFPKLYTKIYTIKVAMGRRLRDLLRVLIPFLLVGEIWLFDSSTNVTPFPLSSPNLGDSLLDPILVPFDIVEMRRHLFCSDHFQFPSVESRVRYYMGGWYNCRAFNVADVCSKSMIYHIGMDNPTMLENILLVREGVFPNPNDKIYLEDVYNFLFNALSKQKKTVGSGVVLTRFGDVKRQFKFPIFVKSRPARAPGIDPMTVPILAPYRFSRHFQNPIHYLDINAPDLPWNNKTNTLVWRGASTGLSATQEIGRLPQRLQIIDAFMKKYGIDGQLEENGEILFDIGFTSFVHVEPETEAKYQYLLKETLGFEALLQHKYLLSIEGNDVSTGLKWMLLSNSVVFMPIPTCVSWAMEELLIPWYHYIPLRDDLMDLVEKISWCREHDAECKQISFHATKYMNDLWRSPQARIDQELILQQMMYRYQSFYGMNLMTCQNSYR